MQIKFMNEYNEIVTFEIDILTNDTFIREKQDEMFKKFITNSEKYKIQVK